ncbi:MAG: ABC transporter permease [Bacillota bacterium]
MKKAFYIALLKIQKTLKQPGLFLVMLLLPVGFTFFMGNMNVGGQRQIPVVIVDEDKSLYSTELIKSLQSNPSFSAAVQEKEQALAAVRDYRAVAAFLLPAGFGTAVQDGQAPSIEVFKVTETGELAAAENALRASVTKVDSNMRIASLALQEIRATKDVAGREEQIRERAYRNAVSRWFPAPPVGLLVEEPGAGKVQAYDQMSHAAIGFALFFAMYTVVFGIGEILEEKRQGTWQRVLILPVSGSQLLGGHMGGTFLIGFAQVVVLILAGKYLFRVNWGHNLPAVLLVVAAFVFCTACLGLLLTGLVRTDRQLLAVTPLLLVSTSMLGGVFWPLEIVNSKLLLASSKVIPQTWAMRALEDLAMRGKSAESVFLPVGVLLFMGAVFFTLGLLKFKWDS